jgi:hypothetical protein
MSYEKKKKKKKKKKDVMPRSGCWPMPKSWVGERMGVMRG